MGSMVRTVLVTALLPGALACRDLSGFTTNGGSYEGAVVSADFVRAGIGPTARLCLTLDADHLQDTPGSVWTSDGLFTAAPMRTIPQIWHDPLSTLSFGEGRTEKPRLRREREQGVFRRQWERRLRRGLPDAVGEGRGPPPAGRTARATRRRPRADGREPLRDLRARSQVHPVLVLGIESSCDETGAAIVDGDGRVLADVVHSQVSVHAPYGGVVPELASRDHMVNAAPVVRAALERAGVRLGDVDGIAVTNRPGLVGALLVGVQSAKGLAWAARKPLVGVDHLMGHLLAVFLRRGDVAGSVPGFPFVCLIASGGHTAIYRVDAPVTSAVRELGATRDDAAGEAFDKVAKLLGLGYPGGPVIDRLAGEVGEAGAVPRLLAPMASGKSLEMSFSGIKTQVAQLVARSSEPLTAAQVAGVCASFQAAVTGVLARKVIVAAAREGVADVVLGGGVAANRELRARVAELGEARGLRVHVPPIASCTDNAAMIAYAGAMRLARGERDGWDLAVSSRTALERLTRKGGGRR